MCADANRRTQNKYTTSLTVNNPPNPTIAESSNFDLVNAIESAHKMRSSRGVSYCASTKMKESKTNIPYPLAQIIYQISTTAESFNFDLANTAKSAHKMRSSSGV